MDPACKLNGKGTRENNDGNETLKEKTSPPLDLDPNGIIEADRRLTIYGRGLGRTGEDRGSHERGTRSTLFNADKTKRQDKTRKKV